MYALCHPHTGGAKTRQLDWIRHQCITRGKVRYLWNCGLVVPIPAAGGTTIAGRQRTGKQQEKPQNNTQTQRHCRNAHHIGPGPARARVPESLRPESRAAQTPAARPAGWQKAGTSNPTTRPYLALPEVSACVVPPRSSLRSLAVLVDLGLQYH